MLRQTSLFHPLILKQVPKVAEIKKYPCENSMNMPDINEELCKQDLGSEIILSQVVNSLLLIENKLG